MHVIAMLPFVLVAAGIALLVLRGNPAPHRHASVRPPHACSPASFSRPANQAVSAGSITPPT